MTNYICLWFEPCESVPMKKLHPNRTNPTTDQVTRGKTAGKPKKRNIIEGVRTNKSTQNLCIVHQYLFKCHAHSIIKDCKDFVACRYVNISHYVYLHN